MQDRSLEAHRRRGALRWGTALAGLLVMAALAAWGAARMGLLGREAEHGAADAPPPSGMQPPPPEVSVVTVEPTRLVLTTELPARTRASLIAEIRPQVTGILQEQLFVEGATVRAGDPLYQIDAALYRAAVEQAEANLVAAQRAAERARAAVEAGRATLARLQATLELAQLNRQRLEELAQSGAVSLVERDQAVTAAREAEAAVRAAEAQTASDEKAAAAAAAAIAQAQAALESARINLAYCRLTAPIGGRVGKSNVTVGALVTAQQSDPLVTIQQLDPMYVDAPQPMADLLRLKRALAAGHLAGADPDRASVRLVLEDGTPYPHAGTLAFSDATVDPRTGSVIVRMTFPNPEELLLPGMYVRAVIEEGVVERAILVPQQCVQRDMRGRPYVLVVGAEGTVEQRMLTVDRAVGDRWLVREGLAAGERVMIEGMNKVRPGMSVVAVPFQAEPTPGAAERPADGR